MLSMREVCYVGGFYEKEWQIYTSISGSVMNYKGMSLFMHGKLNLVENAIENESLSE